VTTDLGVSVSADITSLRVNLALANEAAKEHTAELRKMAAAAVAASDDMRASMLPALQSLAAEEAKAREEVAKLKQEMRGGEEERGLIATFDTLKGRLTSLTNMGGEFREFGELVLAAFAVERVADFVGEITEAGATIEHLSQQLGMPASEISRFAFAAKSMGLDTEQAAKMLERLAKSAEEAAHGGNAYARAFADVGVDVKDANGKIKGTAELLNDLADAFQKSGDGTGKLAIAMELMGRSGADMIPLLNEGSSGLKEMGEQAQRTGSIITGSMAAAMEETSRRTTMMKASFSGLSQTFYDAVEPAIDLFITDITDATVGIEDFFTSTVVGRTSLQVLAAGVDGLAVSFANVVVICEEVSDFVEGVFMGAEQFINGVAQASKDILHGNLKAADADMHSAFAKIKSGFHDTLDSMDKDGKAYVDKMKVLLAGIQSNFDHPGGSDPKDPNKPKPDASNLEQGGGAKSDVPAWQEQLTAKLLAERKFGDDAKAEEVAFWRAKLATIQGSGAQEVAERGQINEKLYSIEAEMHSKMVEAAKEAARKIEEAAAAAKAQIIAIDQQNASTSLEIAKMDLQAKVNNLDAEVSQHKITVAQKFALEEQYAKDKLNLDLGALDAQIATMQLSPVKLNEVLNEERKLWAAYNLEIANDSKDAAAAIAKDNADAAKHWQESLQPVGKAFTDVFEGILEHHQTFVQAMNKLELSLFNDFVSSVEKRVVKWVAGELAQTAASTAGQAARTSAAAAGHAAQEAMDATGAVKAAASAAEGAYAAIAHIPIVGPFLAPAAAAVAFDAVMAFSSEGGMDRVPFDNAPFLLHKDETVLPAEIAQRYRDAAPGSGGGALHVHGGITINQQPGQDGRAMWQAIRGHMSNDLRNGWRPGLARA
jgi:hypothetical protein